MSFIDYLIQNYIWLVAVLVIIIITIIGYIADRRNIKKKEKTEKLKEEQAVVVDNTSANESLGNIEMPIVTPEVAPENLQNWADLSNNNMNQPAPVQDAPSFNMDNMNMGLDNNLVPPMDMNVNTNLVENPGINNYGYDTVSPVEPVIPTINENPTFDMPNPLPEPIVNNDNFSNINQELMNQDFGVFPEVNIPATPEYNPLYETPEFVNPMPVPEVNNIEPVYENEWDNVQTMQIPNILLGAEEPVSEESVSDESVQEEDTDMWKL